MYRARTIIPLVFSLFLPRTAHSTDPDQVWGEAIKRGTFDEVEMSLSQGAEVDGAAEESSLEFFDLLAERAPLRVTQDASRIFVRAWESPIKASEGAPVAESTLAADDFSISDDGESYIRKFSGSDMNCIGVNAGWFGFRTDTDELQICRGGSMKKVVLL